MRVLRFWFIVGIASSALALLSLRPASALQFWLTKVGETTPITELVVGPGEVINLSVWFQHSDPDPVLNEIKGLEIMLTWDRTDRRGTTASPMDNKIVLNGTLGEAVTNIFTDLGAPIFNKLAGARGVPDTTGNIRPWGLRIVWASLSGIDASAGKKAFDISLKNQGLMPGDAPYPVQLWDAGEGSSYTLLGVLGNGNVIRSSTGTYTLNLVPVPEPGGLMALATGVVGLAGIALRRRRA